MIKKNKEKKNRGSYFIVGLLLLGSLITGFVSPAETMVIDNGVIVLKITDHLGPDHTVTSLYNTPWMERVEELTNGKVQFDYYGGSSLVGQFDALEAIQTGLTDIALVGLPAFPTEFPLASVTAMPGISYDTIPQGGRAYKRFLEHPAVRKELLDAGIHVLHYTPFDVGEIMTVKKKIERPGDVEGLLIRIFGDAQAIAVKALKAEPVSIAIPELYLALERGTVDGMIFYFTSAVPLGFDEVIGYATEGASLGQTVTTYSISEDVWQKLDPSIQEAMETAAQEIMTNAFERSQEMSKQFTQQAIDEGVIITKFTEDIAKEWREAILPAHDLWVEEMNKKGLPGRDVLEAWKKAVEEEKE